MDKIVKEGTLREVMFLCKFCGCKFLHVCTGEDVTGQIGTEGKTEYFYVEAKCPTCEVKCMRKIYPADVGRV